MSRFSLGVMLVLSIAVIAPAYGQDPAKTATIYRDTYGVPHIYADTATAGAYALGYAQAEDRLEDIYQNVRTALGSMAEFFGPEYVEMDFALRMIRNEEISRDKWPQAPEHIRAICEAFIAGVKTYIAEHPERVPEYALDLQPWHCAAVVRTMILKWPLGTLMDEYGARDKKPHLASNCWSVAPARSADGCAILLTDPHLEWKSLAVFYEAHVFAGEIAMSGFCLVGSPMIALGHGPKVGWACTTGGPDTSDVYMLKLNPAVPTQYEYEGAWQYMKMRLIKIPVKGEKTPRIMPAMDTMFGPLLGEPDTENQVAYAGRTPYLDDMGLMEQTYKMVTAQNAGEFRAALGMNSFMEQNVMFADCDGNIGYVRVGRVPIRPDGYDWTKPVPGHTKATDWLGFHSIDDLVQIMNPAQGYMQNCNISPAAMMENSPLTPDKYKPYLYNVYGWENSPRGTRAVQLLAADDSITREEAFAIVMDAYDLLSKPWQQALQAAVDATGQEHMKDAEFAEAVQDILAWNGEFRQDSAAAPVVERWRLNADKKVDTAAIAENKPLSAEHQKALLDTLAETLAAVKKTYGKSGVTWGEVHVVGRNGQYYPYDGADFGHKPNNLTETLRCVEGHEDPAGSGRYVAGTGTMSAMLMFFRPDGIESYTCIPWGQSADPKSPHHMDQGRDLFSKGKMKPAWSKKEDLLKNVSEEKVLNVP